MASSNEHSIGCQIWHHLYTLSDTQVLEVWEALSLNNWSNHLPMKKPDWWGDGHDDRKRSYRDPVLKFVYEFFGKKRILEHARVRGNQPEMTQEEFDADWAAEASGCACDFNFREDKFTGSAVGAGS